MSRFVASKLYPKSEIHSKVIKYGVVELNPCSLSIVKLAKVRNQSSVLLVQEGKMMSCLSEWRQGR